MTSLRLTALLLAVFCGHAGAQDATPAAPVSLGAPLGGERLGALRGGTGTAPLTEMRLSGTTSSNTAIAVQTGNNMIADGAFAHMSGLPLVIQNTGANVLIQNAVILNVQMN